MTETTPPQKTGIARYIKDYPDNDLAEAKFVELANLLQPVTGDKDFDWHKNYERVFSQACEFIGNMLDELGIMNGDDNFFIKFENDIAMCGQHATRALILVLFRRNKVDSPRD